ncbi:protein-L-isoaspartate O-methyltransferase family protein [Thauera linaloolentis]|uniref:Protein-L-isoaspartate O-methyltransferase n=1 Tax=Thauera linaloolentis (strain DSM 12138 / JCM 21573 / CCUG 41526 / CIP 105981 / IAM 15112 / NBRC 102519 / 47Lol) TaxID=1123367 RepID=N6ZC65_THAL4|nr:protein-L-isoaspartate O-methyltransferase [Thauera linaloolentis]ENO89769.1 protein-L-isoaspartate(D-aspartate) O-methyltransferase [Thauera linaloolentis 47Lol = DSM 12138]MCM8566067.1 protein-L-isoaspartate O-methyltransferase [Thauera linaloolentis]
MNFEKARFNMVEQQIRPWEVLDQNVLDLLMTVKREEYVPASARALAFADVEIPIGCGQVMLKPVIEGKVLQALQPSKSDSVLEIGTGSGFFAALLAARCEWVRTLEIEPELVKLASANLARNGVENVVVVQGDGIDGWAERAPYDVIVVSGGLQYVPQALLEQLKVGGRLFAFVGEAPVMKARLITCEGEGRFRTEDIFETVVPMLQNAPRHDRFSF